MDLFPGYVVKGLAQIKREEGANKTSIGTRTFFVNA